MAFIVSTTKSSSTMSKTFTHLNEMFGNANKLDDQEIYLDMTFVIGNKNRLYTKLYDKHDDFNFHIVNFPFMSSNIPSRHSYGVSISKLIRHATFCTYYDDC